LYSDLRRAAVGLQAPRVALAPQRLRVELAEDVLLGEVLVADRPRRLALARLIAARATAALVVGRAARGQRQREQRRHKRAGPGMSGHEGAPPGWVGQ